jgi:hypothetical protein
MTQFHKSMKISCARQFNSFAGEDMGRSLVQSMTKVRSVSVKTSFGGGVLTVLQMRIWKRKSGSFDDACSQEYEDEFWAF